MSVKNIIVIFFAAIAVLLLIIGGIWGFTYYNKNMRTPEIFEFTVEEGPKDKPEKSVDKGLSESQKAEETQIREEALKLFLEFPYFKLPVIIVPIVRKGRVYAYLHLHIAMKAKGRKSFIKAKVLLPRLIDGIHSDLYKSFENLWDEKSDPKTSVVRERIFYATENVLGKNIIETIYLREMNFIRNTID